MYSHVMVGTNNMDASKKFYDAIFAELGFGPGQMDPNGRCFYVTETGIFAITVPIDGEAACHANGGTIGFAAATRDAVHAFHAAGLANGGTDEGEPGPREFSPTAYAAYLRDPYGNKICTYCFAEA